VSVLVLLLAWRLGARIGAGTVANAALIGGFVAVIQPWHVLHDLSGWPLAARAGLVALGLVLFGAGSAMYIGAALGAGPRDSLMLVGSLRTRIRIGAVRVAIEVAALAAGMLLGGTFGVGTVAFALLIGPAVEGSFWLVSRTRLVT
jgi:uncharacterized protein